MVGSLFGLFAFYVHNGILSHISGTFMPLVLLPSVTFQDSNYLLPTLEGQYIIKNIIMITPAIVIGRYYLNQPFFNQILKRFDQIRRR